MKTLAIITGTLVAGLLVFLATVGLLYMIDPPQKTNEVVEQKCNNLVQYEDGSQACVVKIFKQGGDMQETVNSTYLQKGL